VPVTKTAKRALRGSRRKEIVNKKVLSMLEINIRVAKKGKREADLKKAISFADRAAKTHTIHKNKAARIKRSLSKLLPKKIVWGKNTKKTPKSSKGRPRPKNDQPMAGGSGRKK